MPERGGDACCRRRDLRAAAAGAGPRAGRRLPPVRTARNAGAGRALDVGRCRGPLRGGNGCVSGGEREGVRTSSTARLGEGCFNCPARRGLLRLDAAPFFAVLRSRARAQVLLFKGVKHVQPDGENDSVRTVGLRFRNPVVGTRMLCRRWRKVFLFQGVQLLSLAATLPVNLLPGIGTAVWIGANGLLLGTRNWPMRPSWWLRTNFDLLSSQLFRVPSAKRPLSHLDAAWDSHLHYLMDYRGMSLRQTKDHVWKNKLEYGAFGATAFTLSVIPLANMVFAVCNTVGAALWAVEIEKQRGNPCFLESRGAASSAGSDAVAALDIAVEPFGAGAQREFGNGTGSAAAVPASTSPGAGAPDETSGPSRSTSTSWLLGTMKAAVR
ncbi:MAG: hypothetical protein BJ554DRAFT_8122 [Olpidium bornovanus]|uniref:Uncharacterized protein n=1 Tax=Olpidium bornovanus TaxID=278681 RepID=A0A8H7ZV23_9FUNG|nr:MAG: hypothetical protein BJ554DRAFT_8122 [Olpidium bornovanus]